MLQHYRGSGIVELLIVSLASNILEESDFAFYLDFDIPKKNSVNGTVQIVINFDRNECNYDSVYHYSGLGFGTQHL